MILQCLRRRNFQGNSEGVIQLKSQVAGKLSQFFTVKECQKKMPWYFEQQLKVLAYIRSKVTQSVLHISRPFEMTMVKD